MSSAQSSGELKSRTLGSQLGVRMRPKLEEACLRLEQLAIGLAPGTRLPTVTELRLQLGVSLDTLNKALTSLERQGVLRRVHGLGIFVAPRVQKSMGLLADIKYFRGANHSPFWDLILERAQDRAAEGQEETYLHLVSPLQRGVLPLAEGIVKEIEEGHIQGILGVALEDEAALWLRDCGIPFVHLFGLATYQVVIEGTYAVKLLAQSLIGQGCQRLGYWRGYNPVHSLEQAQISFEEDVEALQVVLQDNGLSLDGSLMRTSWLDWPERNLTLQEQGYRIAMQVFQQPRSQWPDGILFADDMLTRGALNALDNLRLTPGKDMWLATSSNSGSSVLAGRENELIRAEYDLTRLLDVAFELLEIVMAGGTPTERIVAFKPTLRLPQQREL